MCILDGWAIIILSGLSLFLPNIFLFFHPGLLQVFQPLFNVLAFMANKHNDTYHLKVNGTLCKFYAHYFLLEFMTLPSLSKG